jgi:hypothetical protein
MSRQSWAILVVVLGLVGATAGLLVSLRSTQKLGQPGLKLAAQRIYDEQGQVIGTNCVCLPERVLDYESSSVPVQQVEYKWLPNDTTYGRREYKAADGFRALLSVVLMGTDRTSIHKPEYCVTGQGWVIRQKEEAKIVVERPHLYELPVMKLTLVGQARGADGRAVVLSGVYVYWFVDDRHLTADHKQRMWWLARDLVCTGTLPRWAYVTCFAVCLPGQEDATFARMKRFMAAAVPEFQLTAGPRPD